MEREIVYVGDINFIKMIEILKMIFSYEFKLFKLLSLFIFIINRMKLLIFKGKIY